MSIKIVNTWSSFEDLHNGSFTCNFEDLSLSDRAITKANIDNFGIFREFDVIKDDKRAINFDNSSVINSWSDVVISCHGLNVRAK